MAQQYTSLMVAAALVDASRLALGLGRWSEETGARLTTRQVLERMRDLAMMHLAAQDFVPPTDLTDKCECGHPKGDHYMRYGSDPSSPDWSPVACISVEDTADESVMDACDCEGFSSHAEFDRIQSGQPA
jgi:hypothetical protein